MNKHADSEDEQLGLGLTLSALQIAFYFSFILSSCFAPDAMRAVVPGLGIPLSFVYGAAVIAMGIVLTIIYVVTTNRREHAK